MKCETVQQEPAFSLYLFSLPVNIMGKWQKSKKVNNQSAEQPNEQSEGRKQQRPGKKTN